MDLRLPTCLHVVRRQLPARAARLAAVLRPRELELVRGSSVRVVRGDGGFVRVVVRKEGVSVSGALDMEQIDLAVLAKQLAERVPAGARRGALTGRTAFRDATVDALGCSDLEAEQLVDTLVAQHFLVFEPGSPGAWRIRLHAA